MCVWFRLVKVDRTSGRRYADESARPTARAGGEAEALRMGERDALETQGVGLDGRTVFDKPVIRLSPWVVLIPGDTVVTMRGFNRGG
jgi:hypothetical protein